jgi:hypothetical protein
MHSQVPVSSAGVNAGTRTLNVSIGPVIWRPLRETYVDVLGYDIN